MPLAEDPSGGLGDAWRPAKKKEAPAVRRSPRRQSLDEVDSWDSARQWVPSPAGSPFDAGTVGQGQVGPGEDGRERRVPPGLHNPLGIDTDHQLWPALGKSHRNPLDGLLLRDRIDRHPQKGESRHAASACR